MNHKRIIASIVEVALGLALFILSLLGKADSYWSGMGGALIAVGVLRLFQQVRYCQNPAYRETVNTERNDERNRFLQMKAWSWAGYLFVMLAAVGTIVFKLLNQESLMIAASASVGILILLYWGAYLVLRKKY